MRYTNDPIGAKTVRAKGRAGDEAVNRSTRNVVFLTLVAVTSGLLCSASQAQPSSSAAPPATGIWAKSNMFAWCVVPFDAKKRNSQQRAEMLNRLGITKFAYDWRPADVPTFDTEIETLKQHGIEIVAWWFPYDADDPGAKTTLETFKRHHIHPQLWVFQSSRGRPATQEEWAKFLPPGFQMPMTKEETARLSSADKAIVEKAQADVTEHLNGATKTPAEQEDRVQKNAERLRDLERLAAPYGSKVEMYNHNGWFGVEENQLAMLHRLSKMGINDVGMIYNFSHLRDAQHDDTKNFPEVWKKIEKHVAALNVTGIDPHGNDVYPSQGSSDLALMRVVQQSGWKGPVGIIAEMGGDAEITLSNYLIGLNYAADELKKPGSGGAPPVFRPRR